MCVCGWVGVGVWVGVGGWVCGWGCVGGGGVGVWVGVGVGVDGLGSWSYITHNSVFLCRNLGVGLSSIGARAGGIIAPLVILLVGVHLKSRM